MLISKPGRNMVHLSKHFEAEVNSLSFFFFSFFLVNEAKVNSLVHKRRKMRQDVKLTSQPARQSIAFTSDILELTEESMS